MKRTLRRAAVLALSTALTVGMCINASAFTYPSAYWPVHSAWATAMEAKDPQQAISVAQQTYDLLTKEPMCADICYNLEPKCEIASWCCEMKGDLAGALTWLERQRTFAQWLHDNGNAQMYREVLLNIDARKTCLQAALDTSIYILTDTTKAYPGSGAAAAGTWYGSAVDGGNSTDCASLMYIPFGDSYGVEYWINYYRNTYPEFDTASTQGGIIELAWNFPTESTADSYNVLASDAYIAESLSAMSKMNATVLLRLGAEMNCWGDSDPTVYKQAFQKVAHAAHQYSNIKMVFSPNDVSNRNVTIEDYYPGDNYVDWIGVSTYHNTNYQGTVSAYTFNPGEFSNDAYYGWGIYDNDPLLILRNLAQFANAHNKPMMISECGFSVVNPKTGAQQAAFATDQMRKFYSYVNMIYPQVKAVFYFDHNPNSGTQYTLSNNASLKSTYEQAIADNGGYLSGKGDSGKTWQSLSAANVQSGVVKLATYAIFPGQTNATVTYYVDGKAMSTSSQAPYYFELDTARLAPGTHTVTATATAGQFRQSTKAYTLNVADQGGLPLYTASDWAVDILNRAEENQLITQRNRSNFQKTITRLEFAELAVNLIEKATGKPLPLSETVFNDTSDEVARKAVYADVTAGKGDNRFAPNDPITRQEICVMLNKVIKYVDQTTGRTTLTNSSTQVDAARFNDTHKIAPWATSSVAALTNNGLMSGKGSGVAPLDNTTTQEAITLILSLYNKF